MGAIESVDGEDLWFGCRGSESRSLGILGTTMDVDGGRTLEIPFKRVLLKCLQLLPRRLGIFGRRGDLKENVEAYGHQCSTISGNVSRCLTGVRN